MWPSRNAFDAFPARTRVNNWAKAAVYSARSLLQSWNLYEWLIKLNFSNVINTIIRRTILEAVRAHTKELTSYAQNSYSSAPTLFFGDIHLSLECAFEQGNPLGPLLFALAVHSVTSASKVRIFGVIFRGCHIWRNSSCGHWGNSTGYDSVSSKETSCQHGKVRGGLGRQRFTGRMLLPTEMQ